MTIRRLFHSLARLLRRAIEPTIDRPAAHDPPLPVHPLPQPGDFESRWLRHWAVITSALARHDDGRSCQFVYQTLGLVVSIDGISVAAARELLDATLGAHVAAKHGNGKWPTYASLDARRIDALRIELRHRHGKRAVRVVRPRIQASEN